MSMNEMMRRSANQKREQEQQEQQEKFSSAELVKLRAQIEALSEKMDAQAAKSAEPTSADQQIVSVLGEMNRRLSAIQEAMGSNDASSVAQMAEKLLKTAQKKEERAKALLEEMQSHASTARGVWSDAREQTSKLEQAAATIQGAPKALTAASKSARQRVLKSVGKLGRRAALFAVLIVLVTNGMLIAAGWWYLNAQDLKIEILDDDKQLYLDLGRETANLYNNHWTEEEKESWKTLRKADDKTSKAKE